MIEGIFAAFAVSALVLFRFVSAQQAVVITCFVGWLLLPIGNFPEGSASEPFPYWIIGSLLPSDILLTKIWVSPVVALVGALIADRQSFARWRPRWMDLIVVLWCGWPLGQRLFIEEMEPPAYITSAYLLGAWGAPWVLARIYFSTSDGAKKLLSAIVAGLVVIAPIALLETFFGPELYGWFYGPHPFRFDGDTRYVGFRPLGFFEHGNQYGIWIAATAVAAIWFYTTAQISARGYKAAIAALAFILELMSQSVGAILFMLAGLFALWMVGRSVLRWALPMAIVLVVGCVGTYLTAADSLRTMAETTGVGKQIVDIVRSTGRGSILWRFARDQRAVPLIRQHSIIGAGRWDWWRPNGERPWNLSFLIMGQFGLIGLFLAWGSLLTPVACTLRRHWGSTKLLQDPAVPMMVLVVMAVGDAQFNSFFFYPAILAAGALVPSRQNKSAAKTQTHYEKKSERKTPPAF